MPKKHKESRYEELKEYIMDYLKYVSKIGEDRIKNAEKELKFVMEESKAFNILVQNIHNMEKDGVS